VTTKLFFTADLHLGHVNITKFRTYPGGKPFESLQEHNDWIIDRWNQVVSPRDVVIVVGDFIMGHKDQTLALRDSLNGSIWLVPGNHDGPWSGNPSPAARQRWLTKYTDHRIFVGPERTSFTNLAGTSGVDVCHFPYESDPRHEDRYADHLAVDSGHVLLHGHVHDAWKIRGRQINVGVDAWNGYPVDSEAIADLIQSMPRLRETSNQHIEESQ
jgi:calcineurin-like phosphoesterase family protein